MRLQLMNYAMHRISAGRVLALFVTGIVVALAAPAYAGIIDVYVTDENARYTLYTVQNAEAEFIPIDKIAQIFRLSLSIDPADGRVVLQNDDKSLSFFPQQETVISNRRSYFLKIPPRQIGGVLMVPMEFVTAMLPLIYEGNLAWDAGRRTLQVGFKEVEISNVYVSPYGEYTRVVVELNQTVSYKVTERLPSRITFDLPSSKILTPQDTIQVNSQTVEYVKLITSFGTTQLLVKLGPQFKRYQHQMLENPSRLVIDLYLKAGDTAAVPTPEPDNSGITEGELEPETADGSPAAKKFTLQTVVLDPGHGGSDPGITLAPASGDQPGIFEKDLTLAMAQLLATSLSQRFGEVKVVLTREGDNYIGDEDRTTIANHNRADVFISLHLNRAVAPAASGFEVYVMDYGNLDAATLATQSQAFDYVQAKYIEMSKRLAQRILDAYAGRLKTAPLFTLKGANMPAVHIEIGYTSNPEDRDRLVQPDFQQRLAAAITEGLATFKTQEEP
jgi:N-acetylmuramoyl-L-alanine amidase